MKRFVFVSCAFLCVSLAQAQTNAVRTLSLDEAIQLAVEHNFQVQIDRLLPLIDKLNLASDYGVYEPTFTAAVSKAHNDSATQFSSLTDTMTIDKLDTEHYSAGFNGQTTPWGMAYNLGSTIDHSSGTLIDPNGFRESIPGTYTTFTGLNLTQHLLRDSWIDKPRYKILIDKQAIKYDEWGFRATLIDVVSKTEQAYYELIYAFENIKVQQAALELAERSVAENKRRVEVGAMAPLDEKQAEAQAAQSQSDLFAAYGTLNKAQNTLKNLITDRYTEWHDASITPSQKLSDTPQRFNLQESWELGIAKNPSLMRAKVLLENNRITVKYQYNQVFPQLDLTGSYGRTGVGGSLNPSFRDIRDNRLPSYSGGVILSIPLSNRAARNAYKASKTSVQEQLLITKQTEQDTLVTIDDNIKAANTAYQQVQSTRSARDYAQQALEAEQKKLEVGRSTTFEVLGLQSKLTDARSNEIRALADYNKDLSAIAASIGITLENFRIAVKIY